MSREGLMGVIVECGDEVLGRRKEAFLNCEYR